MGTLKNTNPNPRLTQYLVGSQAFARRPFVVVDVGARGGFESHWRFYGAQIELIGFEPDAEECEKLNQQASTSRHRYFPVALHQSKGKRPFFITVYPASSGFYRPDTEFVKRFPWDDTLTVKNVVEVETTDLVSSLDEHGITYVDFIKLDVEGAELDVLKGAEKVLRSSVIGLSVEVEFVPVHESQPLFRDVDQYLSLLGFMLYDLQLHRHSRRTLSVHPHGDTRGQVTWAQAVYLRDAVSEIELSSKLEGGWDATRILKLASFMELVNLPDCAIELIQVACQRGVLYGWDAHHLIDLLVPTVGDKSLTYDEYMENLRVTSRASRDGHKKIRRGVIYSRKFVPRPVRHVVRVCLIKGRDLIDKVLKT